MVDYSNILFISGAGRNVGKTWLACRLISKYAQHNITGIKISPHFHELYEGAEYLVNEIDLRIIRETRTGNKDSMLMLKAGAKDALYVQATKKYDKNYVVNYVLNYVDTSSPIIIESGYQQGIEKNSSLVYLNEKGEGEEYPDRIEYQRNRWIIHENNDRPK